MVLNENAGSADGECTAGNAVEGADKADCAQSCTVGSTLPNEFCGVQE